MKPQELLLRFFLGGLAVVLSYVASALLPWKALGGIFAAFPAVMIVAVLMMGISQGSDKAAAIARGSVYGMTGCAVCVVTVLYALQLTGLWSLSLLLGLAVWFISAMAIYKIRARFQTRVHR
ncbi:hypothetical protein FHS18_003025 [Paenibacillus phyllosphaerae]|uniref:DUF3147 family protein n=1 Tax=Paenibacillus phyllosphaerae TaxID=274593 RepID=A0A7W5AYK5_9BACL|nr:DUF3147 family protein [Paenibacillus phyllosphaerae]MBB3110957.1 hypothetical protein [Paenibacillus phyllosphaerae]